MPEISRFYGIVVAIYYGEHNPPHFHAKYGKSKVAIDIQTREILEGGLPRRALNLALEWASMHQDELMQAWEQAQNNIPPQSIEPLE